MTQYLMSVHHLEGEPMPHGADLQRAYEDVDRPPLEGYHPYHATRADLLRRLGRTPEAREEYDAAIAAIAATGNRAERAWLTRRRRDRLV